MDYALFIESMDYEFNKIHEDCDRQISYIFARYEESVLGMDFVTEAEKSSGGGLVGMVKRVLETIVNGLKSLGKTVKGVLFGTEVDKSKENKQVNLDKNPNILLKLINGNFKTAKDFLDKAMKGEVDYDTVQSSINKSNGGLKQIAGTAMTLGSIFGICKVGEKYLSGWQKDIEDAYRALDKNTMNAVEQIARTQGTAEKKATTDRCVKLVLQHMNSLLKDGENCFESLIRRLYMEKYVRKKLTEQADLYGTKKGTREIIRQGKAEAKRAKKRHEAELNREKNLQDADAANRKYSTIVNDYNNKTANVRNHNYTDSDESTNRNTSGSKTGDDSDRIKKEKWYKNVFKRK